MRGIHHFEFTGEKRDTINGEWYYAERDAMVSKADWFNEKNVWILRPVPKPKPTFKPGEYVVCKHGLTLVVAVRDGNRLLMSNGGWYNAEYVKHARQSDFEVTRGGHKFLLWDEDGDGAPYLYVDGKRDGDHCDLIAEATTQRALCDALGLVVMPADIEEG
jgi:hypothetical protein